MNRRVSLKQMLIDLIYILLQANLYVKGNANYSELLAFLNPKNYYLNEEISIPSLKEISKETGISIDILRRQIKNLYLNLVDRFNGYLLILM
ncbi:hypothetical protein ACNR9Q_00345 [Maribacter sp. X9]|uniref:hypothetical protein n=1 Tax=Maribacter sp. X9 TaxID=3402159 RepID=UPI003AF37104